MHGISINVEKTSLDPFRGIVPCGLVGREVCCINDFLDQPLTVAEFSVYMRQAMEEIFCIKLKDASTKHF
jgi:lipoate-protein ligase B